MVATEPPNERLKYWIEKRFGSQQRAADHLGVTQGCVAQLVLGHKIPSVKTAVLIERATTKLRVRGDAVRVVHWADIPVSKTPTKPRAASVKDEARP